MILRQLFDRVSSTYTYLLADSDRREAVLIDSVFEEHARDAALIHELGLKLLCTLDTHCHADHVTGAWLMKSAFGSGIGLSPEYGATNVDHPLVHGGVVRFGAESLEIRATPGHTAGCLSRRRATSSSLPSRLGTSSRTRFRSTRNTPRRAEHDTAACPLEEFCDGGNCHFDTVRRSATPHIALSLRDGRAIKPPISFCTVRSANAHFGAGHAPV